MSRFLRIMLLAGMTAIPIGLAAAWIGYRQLDRTPSELLRYAEHRLDGHTRLENLLLPILHAIRVREERPIPESGLPTLGKGVRPHSLAAVRYSPDGQPLESMGSNSTEIQLAPHRIPDSPEAILRAIAEAKAGTMIEIAPGRYRITAPVGTRSPGTPGSPIVVRAAKPETVTIEFDTVEGFQVIHPYWVFENLVIRGVCKDDSSCEHAFHIVGKAHATVIRNNRIEDFNAHIKVNGLNGDWPDRGLIQYNTLTNARRRETELPVTPIDIVGASDWRVADNLISNFVKGGGDRISYGIFMKGGGSRGHIERNLLVCADRDISQAGIRIGLSFGGGGTSPSYCRDKRCDSEHSKGIAANNVIAHCNDFGIDVNRSTQTTIAHNTLINTSGIDVRNVPASATVCGNLLDGRIRARNEGWVNAENNQTGSLGAYLKAPDQLELSWLNPTKPIPTAVEVDTDFCRYPRPKQSLPGALTGAHSCAESNLP